MTIGDAFGVLAFFLGIAAIITVIAMDVNGVNPLEMWQTHRRKTREKHLPIYERLARSEEREAEQHLDWGNTDRARHHYREAQRIRTEATEAMMKGEQPPL